MRQCGWGRVSRREQRRQGRRSERAAGSPLDNLAFTLSEMGARGGV